jgi:hypothetical protein
MSAIGSLIAIVFSCYSCFRLLFCVLQPLVVASRVFQDAKVSLFKLIYYRLRISISFLIFFNPALSRNSILRQAADIGDEQPEASKAQSAYQLDFTTPGSLPWDANTRKHIRQIPNFLKKPRGRPQIGHLL